MTQPIDRVINFSSIHRDHTTEVDLQEGKWEVTWTANRGPPIVFLPVLEAERLPRPPLKVLRRALWKFHFTSIGLDNLHPREFLSLSDEALEVLLDLFEACERISLWPSPIMRILIGLIPKPLDKGGGV